MAKAYTVKKAYAENASGKEVAVWHILYGNEIIVDAFDRKKDAQLLCDKWNNLSQHHAEVITG
jgi:hypothetical protein